MATTGLGSTSMRTDRPTWPLTTGRTSVTPSCKPTIHPSYSTVTMSPSAPTHSTVRSASSVASVVVIRPTSPARTEIDRGNAGMSAAGRASATEAIASSPGGDASANANHTNAVMTDPPRAATARQVRG
jgi:hypothetical protein